MNGEPALQGFAMELLGIGKVYGSTDVLQRVDLRVRPGRIHALLGANGAGKSTLLKIANGATPATAGRVMVEGLERHFTSPLDARRSGIGMVFQERSLLPDLSVADNIFLNDEIRRSGVINKRAEVREATRIFDQLGVRVPPATLVRQLSVGDQQMVEIAKALRVATRVLILDEPTAALTEREVQRLFAVVRQIATSGVAIFYVSHRLAEVFELCDEVTVLRDGRVVMSCPLVETGMRSVVEAIAGGVVEDGRERVTVGSKRPDQVPVLEVRGMSVGSKLRDVSFEIRRGEILGVAGLAGSGRSTLLKALYGAIPRRGGEISVGGVRANPGSPAEAVEQGLYLIPEDRKTEALVMSHSLEANLILSILKRLRVGPLFNARRSSRLALESIDQLRIQTEGPRQPVEWLSGGNQQKVVLGKAFNAHGRVLLLDEPTFGVDVRSAVEIRARVRAFADSGNGAVWVTSDLREMRQVADRILILADGTVRDIVSNAPEPRTESEITHLIQPRSVTAGVAAEAS
jgi:ribose transport system ATP-binding protein